STSIPVSSRTALAYSVRFNRWRFAVRPGFRWAEAALSSSDSSHVATLTYVAFSGRRLPAGGMDRLRSFTMTFSQVSAELNRFSVSAFSSVRPPVFSRSLWQAMQYVVTRSATGVAEKDNGEEHKRHKKHIKDTTGPPLVPLVFGFFICICSVPGRAVPASDLLR